MGCVDARDSGAIAFVDAVKGEWSVLTGNTTRLNQFPLDQAVRIEGIKDDSTHPPTIEVTKTEKVNIPGPTLSAGFRDRTNWRAEKNKKYGIAFAYPGSLERIQQPEYLGSNFVEEGSVEVASLLIPRETYSGSNFVGGRFSVRVNSRINDDKRCEEF